VVFRCAGLISLRCRAYHLRGMGCAPPGEAAFLERVRAYLLPGFAGRPRGRRNLSAGCVVWSKSAGGVWG